MADVTRDEFDALVSRVAQLEAKTFPVTPPAKAGVELTTPVVSANGTRYNITGVVTAWTKTTFAYLQIAVRGPDARDLDMHPGAKLGAGESLTLNGSAAGSAGGEYTTWLAYSKDGTSWVDGPKATFTLAGTTTGAPADETTPAITPEPVTPPEPPTPAPGPAHAEGDRAIALAGKSKLGFNSLVFRQTRKQMEEFGRRRGQDMDGLLYFTGRQNWPDFEWRGDGQKSMLDEGLIVVTTMPHAPEREGGEMNRRGADNAYREQQIRLGRKLVEQGFNRPNHVVRVDWEANGNWYAWSANRPGGAPALKQAIINYVTNLREGGCDQIRFDLCWNQGPDQSGASFEFFPGPEYIDIVGIDQYDMWWPTYDESAWEKKMARSPSVRTVAQLARDNGIMWAWDEGGNTHGDRNQGGDNPFYWDMVKKEIERNAANCAWHVTYDDPGAPASLMHDFARNPRSWDRYRQLWRP